MHFCIEYCGAAAKHIYHSFLDLSVAAGCCGCDLWPFDIFLRSLAEGVVRVLCSVLLRGSGQWPQIAVRISGRCCSFNMQMFVFSPMPLCRGPVRVAKVTKRIRNDRKHVSILFYLPTIHHHSSLLYDGIAGRWLAEYQSRAPTLQYLYSAIFIVKIPECTNAFLNSPDEWFHLHFHCETSGSYIWIFLRCGNWRCSTSWLNMLYLLLYCWFKQQFWPSSLSWIEMWSRLFLFMIEPGLS